MVKDLDYLSRRLFEIGNGVVKAVDHTKKDAADQALFNLVYATPVDVGTARSNWAVGIGGGFIGQIRRAFSPYPSRWKPRPGVNPGGKRSERANMFAAINLGKRIIRTAKPEQDIYIGNHLPYIVPLNRGHSKQSQPGFVGIAVGKAAKTAANKAVVHLRRELR